MATLRSIHLQFSQSVARNSRRCESPSKLDTTYRWRVHLQDVSVSDYLLLTNVVRWLNEYTEFMEEVRLGLILCVAPPRVHPLFPHEISV